ncbi:MAG TPA: aminotransferase class V-fold PLP-dependent enzyme [Bacillota bacterium]|nr:aminotransferase class V-fold PLP-dependent enzyme [Bacillota bacterium]
MEKIRTSCLFGQTEDYFQPYRNDTIGIHHYFQSPYGRKKIIYADWTASGRLYRPIERKIAEDFGPYVANTHTESNVTGTTMTQAYHHAGQIIKKHVHAAPTDALILTGSGMTAAVNKLQRILGLRLPEAYKDELKLPEEDRPIIFITHMEHHSNQLSWMETVGDVVILEPKADGCIDPKQLKYLLEQNRHRKHKIGSFTACSNVTGIQPPYYQLARLMHQYGGTCFVDFSASAPYVKIDMHPRSPLEKLDGIFFSPHKFLGGPGSSGVLLFDSKLYKNHIPDHPGGGTVNWTDPWGGRHYFSDLEIREDGGTPGFLQGIRAALCIKLKEKMGVHSMLRREKVLLERLLTGMRKIPRLHILQGDCIDRLGIVSFLIEGIHYQLVVKLLNDRFGIQVRGGCSCAGTYGHYLFHLDQKTSTEIMKQIDHNDLSHKPGWVRLSIHPIMTDEEVNFILKALNRIVEQHEEWTKDYRYDPGKNDFDQLKNTYPISLTQLFSL